MAVFATLGSQDMASKMKKTAEKSWSTFIYKVLKQVHPEVGISNKAMAILNSFVSDILGRYVFEGTRLLEFSQKTFNSRVVQTSTRLLLPGELAKHAVSEGTKAVTKYNMTIGEKDHLEAEVSKEVDNFTSDSKPSAAQSSSEDSSSSEEEAKNSNVQESSAAFSRSLRAGLVFPVGRVARVLKQQMTGVRVGTGSAVYLAAVLEYLTAEVLELTGNTARASHCTRITPRHIMLALRNDEELNLLLSSVTIPFSGVPASDTSHEALAALLAAAKISNDGEEEEDALNSSEGSED
jgi:histone H3/H4